MRHARKVDTTQAAIVAALRAAGWRVDIIEEPVDLLCYKNGVFKCLEVKSPRNKAGDPVKDKRRVKQDEFIAATGTERVCTPEAALSALESSWNRAVTE